ncbi:hypothetical protein D3C85_664730 [compost metagenome]
MHYVLILFGCAYQSCFMSTDVVESRQRCEAIAEQGKHYYPSGYSRCVTLTSAQLADYSTGQVEVTPGTGGRP